MNFIKGTKRKLWLLGLAVMLAVTGCASGGSFTGAPTKSRIIYSSPHEQQFIISNEKLIVQGCNILSKPSESSVEIGCAKVRYSYDSEEWETWEDDWEHTHFHIYGIVEKTRRRLKKESPRVKRHNEITPSLLEIHLGDIIGKNVNVSRDGSFKTEIISPRLKPPKSNTYSELWHHKTPVHIRISKRDPMRPMYESSDFIKLGETQADYFYKPDNRKIRKFVDEEINQKIFPVTINVKDQLSRVPISSRIEIECLDSIDIIGKLQKEFQDGELLKIAEGYMKKPLTRGLKDAYEGQTISFNAVENARYKVQTLNPRYNYFSTIFTANRFSRDKDLLLIEKGSKVNVDSPKIDSAPKEHLKVLFE